MTFKNYLVGILAAFTAIIATAEKHYEVEYQITASEFKANTPYLLSSNYGLTKYFTNNGTTFLAEPNATNPLSEQAIVTFVPANEQTAEGFALYYMQVGDGAYLADQEIWDAYDSSDMKQDGIDPWEPAPYMSVTDNRAKAAKWTVLPAETRQMMAKGDEGYLRNWRTWTGEGTTQYGQKVVYPDAFVIMRDKLTSAHPNGSEGGLYPVYLETQSDYTFFASWGSNSWFICEASEIDNATILINWVTEVLPNGIDGIRSQVGTEIGTFKEASIQALVEAFEAYDYWYHNSFDDTQAIDILERLKTAYAQLERNGITDGYYYIKSGRPSYSAYVYDAGYTLHTGVIYELPEKDDKVSMNAQTKSYVWNVARTDKGYTFQNVATGNYVQPTDGYPFVTGLLPQAFQLDYGVKEYAGLVYIYTTNSDGSEYCAWNSYWGYADTPVGNWSDHNDFGNYWSFIPVEFTEIEEPENPGDTETPEVPEESEEEVDTPQLFVHLNNGGVHAYPVEIVQTVDQDGAMVNITLIDNSVETYAQADVDSISNYAPQQLPHFTSFKFNNKYNDQVFTDVEATVTADSVHATIGAIGKWLTPSFQLSDNYAKAWVKGVEQKSKQGRVNCATDVVYTIGYDNWKQYVHKKIQDEVWSEGSYGEPVCEPIALTVSQLSSNAPSNRESSEGFAMLLDNNTQTYFHSTWGTGTYEKLPLDQCPYIEIALDEAVDAFVFGYTTRYDVSNRFPQAFSVKVSNDGASWTDAGDFGADQGVPQSGIGQTFESPAIVLNKSYKYIRLIMTQANYKNYLCLSELWLKKVVSLGTYEEPTLISPAQYAITSQPYGRKVCVSIDWLTDKAPVPTVYIYTNNGQLPADKVTYLRSYIRIDGAGVFPNFSDSVNIRGRGNTSWAGQYGKSPYRLKFDSSKKPFGLTKGKSWVLLANRQTGSMLSNAVAMKIASMVGTAGANRIIPIELYINDQYRGSYNFTQQVGLSNNSIDLDDESNAVLLELDTYYDEDYKFKTPYYSLPANIKDPDLAEDYADPNAQFSLIQDDFNHFDDVLSWGTEDYVNLVDVEMLARFLMVNELVMNSELGHPKSTFLYKEDLKALHSRYVFGPVWDFDWAFGYQYNSNYCTYNPTCEYFTSGMVSGLGKYFFNNLRYQSEAVARAYYKVWTDFMENHYQELLDFVDTYYNYAQSSFINNAKKWGDGGSYNTVKNNTINWLEQRAKHIYKNLETYDISAPMYHIGGDVNLDGYITVADVVCIINNIFGQPNDSFDFAQADLDGNGAISINDAVHAIALVMNQPEWSSAAMSLPKAAATLKMQQCQMGLGENTYCPLALQVDTDDYVALQFDLQLPEQVTLQDVDLSENFNGHKAVFQQMGEGKYRVIVYSDNGKALPAGTHELHLALNAAQALPESKRIVSTSAALLTNKVGEDMRLAAHSAQFDVTPTGIQHIGQEAVVRGGKMLYVESVSAQTLSIYAVDGRLIKTVDLQPGKNVIALPNGVYVVNDTKIMICK